MSAEPHRLHVAPDSAGRAAASPEGADASAGGGLRLAAVRAVNYLANYVVNRIPSFTVRHRFYVRVLGVRIGPGAGIHLGCRLWFYGPGQLRRNGLTIGVRSRINRDCTLDARGSITIGEDVSISPEVFILTASHGVDDPEFRVETRPVVIEDHVWIGTRAVVMPGVRLGRGCVVCAGAVVTRDVAPLDVVGGVPARTIRRRDEAATGYRLDGALPWFE